MGTDSGGWLRWGLIVEAGVRLGWGLMVVEAGARMGTQGGSLVVHSRGPRTCEPEPMWSVADSRSSRMALLRTRRTSSYSKAFRSCSSLKAVRTRSTALGRIAPEDGEVGEDGEMGEAGVRGPLSACPPGVETCRQIRTLSEAG